MTRLSTILAALAIGGAGVYAAYSTSTPESRSTPEPERAALPESSAMPPGHPPIGAATATATSAVPPGHPPIGVAPPPARAAVAEGAAPAPGPEDLAWDAPSAWQSVPNANAMRTATFKIPRAAGDVEDAELTVMTAAGGVDANVRRWAGQFGDAEPKIERRSPHGLRVTVVEIKGTYATGAMMGGPATPTEKQMLLGAIVEAGDLQHFFKMTGPEDTVTAAKKDFDAFVASFRAK